jgi:hypothetical protein
MKVAKRTYVKPRRKPTPKENPDDMSEESWEMDYIQH